MSITIGVLAIQGDVHENVSACRSALTESGIDGRVINVMTTDEISGIDGLVIPGGESTTIGQLLLANKSMSIVKERIQQGMPVLGICAGMILLSNTVDDSVVGNTGQPLLGILDMKIERNSFGRQGMSFETDISMNAIGISKFNGVFIRAPSISTVTSEIKVLSKLGERIVAVKKDNVIGTAFHPELAGDISLHKYFVSLAGA